MFHWIWKALLFTLGSISIYFSYNAYIQLYNFFRLKEQTHANITNWSITNSPDNKYIVQAQYTFSFEDKQHQKAHLFKNHRSLNFWGANSTLKDLSSKPWSVWFDPKNASNSSLQKLFPYKESIYAILLFAIFIYFIFLSLYFKKNQN